MFSKIRSRGASPEGSGSGDSLETFPVCSSLSRTTCTHAHTAAFYPADEKSHMNAARTSSRSLKRAAGRTGLQRVAPLSLSEWNDADVFRPLVSSPFCLQWGSAAAARPECCEALFIKSIPPPWPRGSHANCCLLRPFSTFLFFFFVSCTCTPTRACSHTQL